jgi:hypothetical protein
MTAPASGRVLSEAPLTGTDLESIVKGALGIVCFVSRWGFVYIPRRVNAWAKPRRSWVMARAHSYQSVSYRQPSNTLGKCLQYICYTFIL